MAAAQDLEVHQKQWAMGGATVPEGKNEFRITAAEIVTRTSGSMVATVTFKTPEGMYHWEDYQLSHRVGCGILQQLFQICGIEVPDRIVDLPEALAALIGYRVSGAIVSSQGKDRQFRNIRINSRLAFPDEDEEEEGEEGEETEEEKTKAGVAVRRKAKAKVEEEEPTGQGVDLVGMPVQFAFEGSTMEGTVEHQDGEDVRVETQDEGIFEMTVHDITVSVPPPEPEAKKGPRKVTKEPAKGKKEKKSVKRGPYVPKPQDQVRFEAEDEEVLTGVITAINARKGEATVDTGDARWKVPTDSLTRAEQEN